MSGKSFYYRRLPYEGHVINGEPFSVGESNDGSSKTEQSGARSSEQQIKMMFQAGERLAAWRAGYFDYEEGEEVGDETVRLREQPSRSSNYDLSDAHLDASYLSGKLTAARRKREEKLAEDQKQKFDAAVAAAVAAKVDTPTTPVA